MDLLHGAIGGEEHGGAATAAPTDGDPSAPVACLAPSAAMRFNPDGIVSVCCVNTKYAIGNVRTDAVEDIWGSPATRELERALDHGDFSLGCQECGELLEADAWDDAHAVTFEQHRDTLDPRWPRRLEFALSNRCNLMCVQCNGELSSSIRTKRDGKPPLPASYGEAFFDQIRPFLPHAERCVFLGGEPFLQPEAARVWDMLLELDPATRPQVDVTTNGTIWNAKVERYVRELAMNVAVSLDGTTTDTTDAIRVGSRNERVLEHARRFGRLAHETGAGFAVNTCVMPDNVHELLEILRFVDEIDAEACPHVVTYPPRHSLLHLSHDELARALAGLEADDERAQQVLHRSRDAWDRVLDRLRSHLVDLEVPVELAGLSANVEVEAGDDPPKPPPAVTEAELVRADLADERAALLAADKQPVRFRAVGGIVIEVHGEPWANGLRPATWLGTRVDGLLALVGDALGTSPVVAVTGLGERLVEAKVTSDSMALRVAMGRWQSDVGEVLDGLVSRIDR